MQAASGEYLQVKAGFQVSTGTQYLTAQVAQLQSILVK